MKTTIRKIGNSEGIIIPKDVLVKLDLKAGDEVQVVEDNGNVRLIPAETELSKQLEAARECMDKYRVALRELAK